jgi:rhodanese-related sulfurtransferase
MTQDREIGEILERAATRAKGAGLPYAGAVLPAEAWELVSRQAARLVDVRTEAEVKYVGHVPGSAVVVWRGGEAAARADFLERLAQAVAPGDRLLFLWRSGGRSDAAAKAAASSGFAQSFNVLEGFEGRKNEDDQRGFVDGWRKHGLPWTQD